MKHRDRGDINAGHTAISSKNFAEDWTLDMTGNWPTFKQDTDGNGTWDLNQSRTHDVANQITQIAGSSTHVAHDLCGNMTKAPKPDNWSAHFDLTFDAWNRLVKVVDGLTTVAKYGYDGRNFRLTKTASGVTRHYFYSSGWQVLEERVGSAEAADRQNVWGVRYVDDLVLRDRDADSNSNTGTLGLSGSGLEERLYALQDPNWNIVAIAGANGAIQERYSYTAYGTPTFLTAASGSRGSSSYAWDVLCTGRQFDAEISEYHYRRRPYGANLGRFLSRDLIETIPNPYFYCDGTPLMMVDPSGMVVIVPCFELACEDRKTWSEDDCTGCCGKGCTCAETQWGKSLDMEVMNSLAKKLNTRARGKSQIVFRDNCGDTAFSLRCPCRLKPKSREISIVCINITTFGNTSHPLSADLVYDILQFRAGLSTVDAGGRFPVVWRPSR